jgi:hypothetical protein
MSEQEMTVTAYIGLGSNMGDERSNLAKALELLQAVPGVALVKTASYYRSAPLGRTDQDWYLNTVAEVKTSLEPQQLLHTSREGFPTATAVSILTSGLARLFFNCSNMALALFFISFTEAWGLGAAFVPISAVATAVSGTT